MKKFNAGPFIAAVLCSFLSFGSVAQENLAPDLDAFVDQDPFNEKITYSL